MRDEYSMRLVVNLTRHVRFLCVPYSVRDFNLILLTMCVLSAPNRVGVCRESHRHVRFLCAPNRVRDLRQSCLTYAILCMPNRVRVL